MEKRISGVYADGVLLKCFVIVHIVTSYVNIHSNISFE